MSGKRRRRTEGRSEAASPPGTHWVPGERAVRELLEVAPERVQTLWIADRGRLQGLADAAAAAGVEVEIVGPDELRRRAPGIDARGVVAVSTPRAPLDLEDLLPQGGADAGGPRRLWLALDGVVDPGNLGAILRSAEFFGVEGVFWPKDRAAGLTPAAVRASAGASERMPFAVVTNLARALQQFGEAGAWVLGTVAEGGQPLPELVAGDALPAALVVVMGAEHTGLRRLTRDCCDFLATIPRRGAVASLNVSAATAVVLAALAAS